MPPKKLTEEELDKARTAIAVAVAYTIVEETGKAFDGLIQRLKEIEKKQKRKSSKKVKKGSNIIPPTKVGGF